MIGQEVENVFCVYILKTIINSVSVEELSTEI